MNSKSTDTVETTETTARPDLKAAVVAVTRVMAPVLVGVGLGLVIAKVKNRSSTETIEA